jgi:hypothetical protein
MQTARGFGLPSQLAVRNTHSGKEPELHREHDFFLSKKPRAGKLVMHNLCLANMQLSHFFFNSASTLNTKYSATFGFIHW